MSSTIDILQAFILGLVQGLTEWLPVSSSGHLAIVQLAMGLRVPVFFDLVLHLGTLAGVFAVYRQDISDILRSIITMRGLRSQEGSHNKARKMLFLIILGTIPTAIIGVVFRQFFEASFFDPVSIGIGFVVTGVFILITGLLKPGTRELGKLDALLIGVGQGLSIFSSISRSGATIAAGMFRGVERAQLVRYSFLLSIPAIAGAAALDAATSDQRHGSDYASIPVESYVVGVVVSGVIGYLSIRALIRLVIVGKFYAFAFYCFAIAAWTFLFL